MLVWIQVKPGWENDPVWIHDGWQEIEVKSMSGYPPSGIHWVAGGNVEAGIRIIAT